MEDFFIPVHIDPENKNPTYTQYVYQWDYGLYLKITGVDIPTNTPVAFSNRDVCGNALRMIATTSDGVTTVKIPDILLADQEFCFGNLSVYAWITLVGESGSKTIYKIVIPVHSRPKPEDYTDPGTDDPFADTIEQVKQYADQAEQSAQQAQDVLNQASETFVLKNQGIENACKALVIDDAGNVVPGKSGADLDALEKIAIKPTATGTDIVAEDSADWRLLDLSAQGWTEQTTTTGKNLFDYENLVLVDTGITSENNTRYGNEFKNPGTYYINPMNLDNLSGKGDYIYCQEKRKDGTFGNSIYIVANLTPQKQTITITEGSSLRLYIAVQTTLEKAQEILGKYYITVSLNEEMEMYEPYSGGYPSPRPTIRTNQLFDASNIPTKSENGATVTNNDDGSFTISGSGSINGSFTNFYNIDNNIVKKIFKEGTIYSKVENVTNPRFIVQFRNTSETLLELNNNSDKEITKEILEDPDLTVRYGFYGPASEIFSGTIRPMLYQDGDGSWEPYTVEAWEQPIVNAGEDAKTEDGKYPVEIKIGGSQLWKNPEPKTSYGVTLTVENDGWVVLNGTATESYNFEVTNNVLDGEYTLIVEKQGSFHSSSRSIAQIYSVSTKNSISVLATNSEGIQKGYLGFSNDYRFRIFVDSGFTYNNSKVRVTLNKGARAFPWEPYKSQTVTITSDRPLTKWDRLEKRGEKWGWSYRSENVVYDGSTDENWIANESAGTNAFSIFNGNTIYNTIFCNKLKRYVGAVSQIPYGSIQEVSLLIILKIENIASVDELRSWMAENPLNVWINPGSQFANNFKNRKYCFCR